MRNSDGELPMVRRSRFVTFDGAFESTNLHQRPDRYRHLEMDLGRRKRIARGAGMSYVAASFGGESVVQEMSAFDRLLEFDSQRRTVRVEAGLSIGTLIRWAAQHELCVAVVPGYPSITVGGCIAADVHGKNPFRDSTFGECVECMTLFHPARGFKTIDPNSSSDEFETTCGGYGLTGLVVDATIRLVPRPAPNVSIRHVPVRSLDEAVQAIHEASDVDFAYSWHDGSARGHDFGRGVLFLGGWTDEKCDGESARYRTMTADQRAKWPLSLWNSASVRLANRCFRLLAIRRGVEVRSAFDAAFPFARQTLYHRFYGRAGLAEVQVLVPDTTRRDFVHELGSLVQRFDPPLVMISIKRFRARSGSLGMSGVGSLLALDLVRTARTAAFLSELDALVLDFGAQPNVAKDSRLPAHVAARSLPGYESFRKIVRARDPDRLYESELSRRLEL